jgi:hypothetical protein
MGTNIKNRKQQTGIKNQLPVTNGQLPVDNGQLPVDNWAMDFYLLRFHADIAMFA